MTELGIKFLCTGWSPVDLNEPNFEALVHHEIKSKELEAVVGQVLGADCRLNTCQTGLNDLLDLR